MAEQSGYAETLRCAFCGKHPNEVAKLIVSVNVDLEGTVKKRGICNECLATFMTVMAHENRELFDKAVERARSFKAEEPTAENSN